MTNLHVLLPAVGNYRNLRKAAPLFRGGGQISTTATGSNLDDRYHIKKIGTVVRYRAEGDSLILAVRITSPVSPSDINRSTRIGEFRDGVPLGTKFEARFREPVQSGSIEISVFAGTPLNAGVAEANGPQFIGLDVETEH